MGTYWYRQYLHWHWLLLISVLLHVHRDDVPAEWRVDLLVMFQVVLLLRVEWNAVCGAGIRLLKMQYHFLSMKFSFLVQELKLRYVHTPLVPVDKKFLKLVLLQNEVLPSVLLLYGHRVFDEQCSAHCLMRPIQNRLVPLRTQYSFSRHVAPRCFPEIVLCFCLLPNAGYPISLIPKSR